MSVWHLTLPAGLAIRGTPGQPGTVPVFAAACPGAAIGRARILNLGPAVLVTIDDDHFRTDCTRGEQGRRHDHRSDITHGYTQYAKPMIAPASSGRPGTPRTFTLLGIELTGTDRDDPNVLALQPGPGSPIPPAPQVNLTPIR
jgi:hypothetical protein